MVSGPFRFGATMELGRSGRLMMMMTSASASGGDGGVAGSLSEVQYVCQQLVSAGYAQEGYDTITLPVRAAGSDVDPVARRPRPMAKKKFGGARRRPANG
jgi:hypothetical protein